LVRTFGLVAIFSSLPYLCQLRDDFDARVEELGHHEKKCAVVYNFRYLPKQT